MSTAALLRKAAKALEQGQIPLMDPFLSDNDVTLDQCMTLAEQFAIGARMVAYAIENPRTPEGLAYFMALAASATSS